jgi:hypothetical protein
MRDDFAALVREDLLEQLNMWDVIWTSLLSCARPDQRGSLCS